VQLLFSGDQLADERRHRRRAVTEPAEQTGRRRAGQAAELDAKTTLIDRLRGFGDQLRHHRERVGGRARRLVGEDLDVRVGQLDLGGATHEGMCEQVPGVRLAAAPRCLWCLRTAREREVGDQRRLCGCTRIAEADAGLFVEHLDERDFARFVARRERLAEPAPLIVAALRAEPAHELDPAGQLRHHVRPERGLVDGEVEIDLEQAR